MFFSCLILPFQLNQITAYLVCFSYPLLNVPLPGNIPTVVNVPWHINEAHIPIQGDCSPNNCLQGKIVISIYMNL